MIYGEYFLLPFAGAATIAQHKPPQASNKTTHHLRSAFFSSRRDYGMVVREMCKCVGGDGDGVPSPF